MFDFLITKKRLFEKKSKTYTLPGTLQNIEVPNATFSVRGTQIEHNHQQKQFCPDTNEKLSVGRYRQKRKETDERLFPTEI